MNTDLIITTDGTPAGSRITLADGTPVPGVSGFTVSMDANDRGGGHPKAEVTFCRVGLSARASGDLLPFIRATVSSRTEDEREAIIDAIRAEPYRKIP